MPAPVRAVRCLGCGHKVLEATCNSLGRCVACALDEIERDETLDHMLAEIANDTSLDDAFAELDRPNSEKTVHDVRF